MPNYESTIICLANSRKTSGRCIAGKEITGAGTGNWIRPISSRQSHEISFDDRRYQDGNDVRVLDVVTIPMMEPRPHAFQTENHLIDAEYYWRLQRRASYAEARAALDNLPLWTNRSSSYNGTNDRVAEDEADPAGGSLRLIEVNDLEVRVSVEGAAFGNGKRRVRGYFTYRQAPYLLSITDPRYEARYLALPDGRHQIGQALLCISLGEPYQGHAYKLIAAVIRPNE